MAIVATAEAGIRASRKATIVQLRAPSRTIRELEDEAMGLVPASPVPVVISSRCDVALVSGAAGVHLPEHDIGIESARSLVQRGLVGRSVHTLESAVRAEREGADYVIFGPVWASATHAGVAPVGVDALGRVAKALGIPVLAIGGVDDDRIAEVASAGAAGYAAIRLFA